MPQVRFDNLTPGVASLDDLVARRLAIWGISGSGKSTLTKRIYDGVTITAVYFNPEDEAVAGVRVGDSRDMLRQFRKGEQRINYVPPDPEPDDGAALRGHLREAKRVLFGMGDGLRGSGEDKTDPWLAFFGGECQLYAIKGAQFGPFQSMYQQGRKRGIFPIAESQRPAQVSHVVLTQATHHAIFDLSDFENDYFRTYATNVDEFRSWIEKPFHFVLKRGRRWVAFEPLKGVA